MDPYRYSKYKQFQSTVIYDFIHPTDETRPVLKSYNIYQNMPVMLSGEKTVLKNAVYGQHSALSYMCDSGVTIQYHKSKSIPWVLSIP